MRDPPFKPFYHSFPIFISLLISFILLLAAPLNSMAEGVGCDDAFVQLDNSALVINVATTGDDDTANTQCALDVATSAGYPIVRLAAGTYFVSGLIVENFKGTLEGKTKTATIIEVPDRSVDCFLGMELEGLTSAVIKFVKGEPRIRFMTIRANRPCSSTGSIDSILHFTGESAQIDNCDSDVIFGAVDRVVLEGASDTNWINAGVLASAEGNQLGGCKNTLLGTFKLNRSTITDIWWGIKTTMKAGAQVDINFNEFLNNNRGVWLQDTNQNTTISTNSFVGKSWLGHRGFPYWSIYVETSSVDAPAATRVVIHNNQFDAASIPEATAMAVYVLQTGKISNISSVVTNNQFKLSGAGAFGFWGYDVSNTHISANRFAGDGSSAIGFSGVAPVTGATITANKGLATFSSASGTDIRLEANTSECIVGSGQGADVSDLGAANTVLPQ